MASALGVAVDALTNQTAHHGHPFAEDEGHE